MIELSNLTAQTLQPGQSIAFDKVTLRTRNGCECHNSSLPNSVKLCEKGIYDVSFYGNVTGATANVPLQLAIAIGGQPITTTAMNTVVATAGQLHNVGARKLLKNCCCDLDRLSVVNSGTNPVTIAPNSSFIIIRKS